jgi:flagellar protein FlaG
MLRKYKTLPILCIEKSLQGGNRMRIESATTDQTYTNVNIQTRTKASADSSKDARNNQVEQVNKEVEKVTNQKVQEKDVINAIEKANKHISSFDRRLEFSIHDTTKQIMVKVINTEDDTVIREIPSEKVLDMVAHMWEVAGILVDEKR